jgi:hypothetical protein
MSFIRFKYHIAFWQSSVVASLSKSLIVVSSDFIESSAYIKSDHLGFTPDILEIIRDINNPLIPLH